MSDPYNSNASSSGPIAKPDRSTTSSTAPTNSTSRRRLSPSWKRKFSLIEKAGGVELPDFRKLSTGEHVAINFNVLAFLFGPLYYLGKGLLRQAFMYFILSAALLLILAAVDLEFLSIAVVIVVAFVCASRANISYYRKVILNSAPWF